MQHKGPVQLGRERFLACLVAKPLLSGLRPGPAKHRPEQQSPLRDPALICARGELIKPKHYEDDRVHAKVIAEKFDQLAHDACNRAKAQAAASATAGSGSFTKGFSTAAKPASPELPIA